MRLANKTALVTGAAGGLGAAIVRRFLAEGARVIATDINADALHKQFVGTAVECEILDVSQPAAWQQLADTLKQRGERLQILVNNAGMAQVGDLEQLEFSHWQRVHQLNLDSVFLGSKFMLPLMKEQGGSIINMASVAAIIASGNTPAYNSSKAAVAHLSKSIALHCAAKGYAIRCNSIMPVFADTALLDGLMANVDPQQVRAKLARQIPLGRLLSPEDVANAALFLASDESAMMTGTQLVLDGGISAM